MFRSDVLHHLKKFFPSTIINIFSSSSSPLSWSGFLNNSFTVCKYKHKQQMVQMVPVPLSRETPAATCPVIVLTANVSGDKIHLCLHSCQNSGFLSCQESNAPTASAIKLCWIFGSTEVTINYKNGSGDTSSISLYKVRVTNSLAASHAVRRPRKWRFSCGSSPSSSTCCVCPFM